MYKRQDKTYPSYWDLSESTGYISGYEEVQGNPMLKDLFTFPRFSAVLCSAKTNFVLKFSSKAMAAEMCIRDRDNIPFNDDVKAIAENTRAVCWGSLAQRNVVSLSLIHI